MDEDLKTLLRQYADRYETAGFISGDPSWFMHQVQGRYNRETLAFVASCLSYGSRKQFLPKIQQLLDCSGGDFHEWVSKGEFERDIPATGQCFYRLYSYEKMNAFLRMLRQLLNDYDSLGDYAAHSVEHCHDGSSDVLAILDAVSDYFWSRGLTGIVPKPRTSLCKRPVMFLRWMVRDGSPVDLGLWTEFVDKRNLYIPMDTHVFQMSQRLGLLQQNSASWKSVELLRNQMLEVFPDDPSRGDFALFGYDVSDDRKGEND
ncbi:TIGR02757 family protein [Prevotella sp. P3-122]|nr:TIGR02757 family protein [Prevotella sp. P3-122]